MTASTAPTTPPDRGPEAGPEAGAAEARAPTDGVPEAGRPVGADETPGGCGPGVRRGRPRSEEADQAILDAALDLLVSEGYQGMSMEGIAQRAGVGKATLYRRFSDKAQVVVEAVSSHGCAVLPMVDTGDLRADLLAFYEGMARSLAGPDGPIMAAVATEKARHPELQREFEQVFVSDRRAYLRRIIRAAVDRGDLPADTDVNLLALVGPAVLWQQITMEASAEQLLELPRRLVDQFLPAG